MSKLRFPKGIFKVLGIVWKNLLRKNIVINYPWEKYPMPERARWSVQLKRDEEGCIKCTACGICEKTCPICAIKIDVTTDPETRDKHIDRWQYERGGCMMCGLCVEACPFDAIYQDTNIELAHADRDLLRIDLVTDVDAAKPKRAAAKPAPKPAAQPAEQKTEPARAEDKPATEAAKAEDKSAQEEGGAQNGTNA